MCKYAVRILSLLACCLLSSSLLPAADILSVVPKRSLAVIVVPNIEAALEATDKLVPAVGGPKIPNPIILAGLPLEAIDTKGSFGMVVVPGEKLEESMPLMLLPVKDKDKFLDGVGASEIADGIWKAKLQGAPTIVAMKGGYALLMPKQGGDRSLIALKAVLASKSSIAEEVAGLTKTASKSHAYAIATRTGVKMTMNEAIEGVKQMKLMLAGQAGPDGKTLAAGMDMYLTLFQGIRSDVNQAIVELRLDDDDNLLVHARGEFVADGKLDKWAKESTPGKVGDLKGLPGGPYIMAAAANFDEAFLRGYMNFTTDMLAALATEEVSDDDRKEMVESISKMATGMESFSMVLGVAPVGSPIYGSSVIQIQTSDAEAFLKNYQVGIKTYSKLMNILPVGVASSPKVSATKIDGRPALEIEQKLEFPVVAPAAPGAPDMSKIMELMFGDGDALKMYFAATDKKTVTGAYVSKETLRAGMKAVTDGGPGLADDKRLKKTAALLPADSQMVYYINPNGMVEMVRQIMAGMGGVALPILEFPLTPPAGMSVGLSPAGLDLDFAVPQELQTGIGAYVRMYQAQ